MYELSNREVGIIRASIRVMVDLIKKSGGAKELKAEYETLFKRLG